jgi:GTP-binding protein
MFVDRIKAFAQAGNGGRGCVSFRREKFVPKGGPDGGDGGRGGDIVLRADRHVDNLTSLFYEPLIKAKTGGHGQGKKMHGRSAPAKVVRVPIGTIVYRADAPRAGPPGYTFSIADMNAIRESRIASAQPSDGPSVSESAAQMQDRQLQDRQSQGRHVRSAAPEDVMVDLTRDGQEFLLCRGGAGGKGNVHFKSSRNRAPREYTEGEEGEQGHFLFELRTIADAGLVGYPNAGKSTLLRIISAARPKVAPYPFTTLHPIIGVVEFPGYRRAAIADIPGLIEGAHRNLGLGHDFLRHITRCRILLFVVDVAGSEGRNPIEDLQNLRREIDLYDPMLSERPWCIIANKMDLPGAKENLEALRNRFPSIELAAISAKTGGGLDSLRMKLEKWLESFPVAAVT